jgi:hypothetical protein
VCRAPGTFFINFRKFEIAINSANMTNAALGLITIPVVFLAACIPLNPNGLETGNTHASVHTTDAIIPEQMIDPEFDTSGNERIPANMNWNQKGDLYQASAYHWLNATLQKRLATSADFVKTKRPEVSSRRLHDDALAMEHCISETIPRDGRVVTVKVKQLAQGCFNKLYGR